MRFLQPQFEPLLTLDELAPTTAPMRRRVAHVITGLPQGGAETMLWKLLSRIDRGRFESTVISLREEGPLAEPIRSLGIPVESLGTESALGAIGGVIRLRRAFREFAPDLVQTWLYHADLFGGVAAKFAGSAPVVWGIRMSDLDAKGIRASTRAIARICARLSSRLPARIVCCAESGRRWHAALGYDAGRMTVIPNGFDVERFRPDQDARARVRDELAIERSCRIVGLVARYAPQKDHATFVAAAARVAARFPDVRFLLVGHGVDRDRSDLAASIERTGMKRRFHRFGARNDVARLTAACDVAVSSSSFGEAFPNVIGEAMACGVPCVVTDIGDSAWIVGETGKAVTPQNPDALAAAIGDVLALSSDEREELSRAARRRIVEHFSIDEVVRRYEELYTNLTPDIRH